MDRWRPEDGRSWYFWIICCTAVALGALFTASIIAPLLFDAGNSIYQSIASDVHEMMESIGL